MSVPLMALGTLAQQHQTVIVSASQILPFGPDDLPTNSNRAVAIYLLLRSLGVSFNNLGSPLRSLPTPTPARNAIALSCPLLETKYGLRLELYEGRAFKTSNVRACLQRVERCENTIARSNEIEYSKSLLKPEELHPKQPSPEVKSYISKSHYRYRLFSEWRTSYLWYDDHGLLPRPNGTHVDEDVIEGRYPVLQRYYFEWQERYESAFEHQGCHVGSGQEVFPLVDERVAWETEGFLIACWLALQDDVDKVEYKPSSVYLLEKGGMEVELRRFLAEMENLLQPGHDSLT